MPPEQLTVRLGVVGCGVIGREHLKAAAALDSVEVVAVADLLPDAARRAATDFAIPSTYTDPLELLTDHQVEAVILALPTAPRQALALAALQAGKHVLLEKPAAATVNDLRALISARGPLVAACCSARFRTTQLARAATDIITSGRLGVIREIRIQGHRSAPAKPEQLPPAWRLRADLNGGGILWNWGPYDLDLALGICGWTMQPETVFGQTFGLAEELSAWVPVDSDGETHGVGLVRCTSGTVIALDRGEYLPVAESETVQIIGTTGSLTGRGYPGEGAGLRVARVDADGTGTIDQIALTEGYPEISRGLVQDFATAIRTGRPPLTTLENYLTILQIAEGIRTSARTGDLVRF